MGKMASTKPKMVFPEILEMLQEEYKTLQFENYNLKQQLLTAQATLKLIELKNSGEIMKNDEFKLLDPNDASANVTRTGKPIDDLDVSDKTAMNYINTTTKPTGPGGDETAIGSNDTTLVESESVSSNDPDVPGVQQQARVSFCENLVIHNGSREENGLTKTEDGAQTLHKSLLQQNPLQTCDTFFEDPNPAPNGLTGSDIFKPDDTNERLSRTPQFWTNPDESYLTKIRMNEERVPPSPSIHESWNEEVVVKDPSIHNVIDLTMKKWRLIGYSFIKMPNDDSIPQSVAVDRARIYVSH